MLPLLQGGIGGRLVAFGADDIVPALCNDLGDGVCLRMGRIGSDHATFQIQVPQHQRHLLDLPAFGGNAPLGDAQPLLHGPDIDDLAICALLLVPPASRGLRLPRRLLPSQARCLKAGCSGMLMPQSGGRLLLAHWRSACSKAWLSSAEKTRLKVSWLGVPPGSSKKVRSHSSWSPA